MGRALKREEIELQFLIQDHAELAQPTHKPTAATRRGEELDKFKKSAQQLEDVMTDRALGVIARARGIGYSLVGYLQATLVVS